VLFSVQLPVPPLRANSRSSLFHHEGVVILTFVSFSFVDNVNKKTSRPKTGARRLLNQRITFLNRKIDDGDLLHGPLVGFRIVYGVYEALPVLLVHVGEVGAEVISWPTALFTEQNMA